MKFIGIDGEGSGRFPHNYTLLAASYEDNSDSWHVVPGAGRKSLTTKECLDMILELPTRRTKVFSFSFNYDITMMLRDLDNESLFHLMRPEMRQRSGPDAFKGPYPVYWEGYLLNLQGTKFTVRREKKRVVIWDLFKFFQGKFVTALRDWKIGNPELHARMERMKNMRHEFDELSKTEKGRAEILAYCLEETTCMAQLARKLVDSHNAVDLKLKAYYGAGSSGAAMLTYMGIKEKLSKAPPEMGPAIAQGFFGGRFENSVIGDIRDSLYNFDISSAYVYQLYRLPCLEHAKWVYTKNRDELKPEAMNGALVHYALGDTSQSTGWGPFPFRTRDGSIAFPIESGGGWIWYDEYIQGEKLWPHVIFKGAWVYKQSCDCEAPFKEIPRFYNRRLEIGKEGPGLVIKLGMNSCYGKLAQSVGNAIFNSWIWAGMITSGTRAQLLELIGLHKDRENVLMLATDGLLTRELIVPPKPMFTDTDKIPDDKGKIKPLGGWEKKEAPNGMFIARPGIYFPLNPTEEELSAVRARGVGRNIILKHWQLIVDTWKRDGVQGVAIVANVQRFCGAKTSISVSAKGFKRAKHRDGIKPAYAEWVGREVGMGFDPMPKREKMHSDGLRLLLRKLPSGVESAAYDRAVAMQSKDAQELRAAAQEMLEQPEGDLTEYYPE